MKWLIIAAGAIILFTLVAYASRITHRASIKTILINNKPLTIEIADNPAAYKQGLGDRDSMPLDHGMLFVFDHAEPYFFWMRHMRFPLDIIWINQGQVVEIAATVEPPTADEIPIGITPKMSADRVLELNAGQAEAYGLRVGDIIHSLK